MNYKSFECDYKMDLPYPPIRVEEANCTYGSEMLSNMADVISEISDVTRYFYNSVVMKQNFPSFSTCYHHISIVEMHHLNMFAELALLLGEDPRLWCGRNQKTWWSPSYLTYPNEAGRLIMDSIEAERAAINKYSCQANTIKDENIVAVLNRIILDEERHIEIFSEMYYQLFC